MWFKPRHIVNYDGNINLSMYLPMHSRLCDGGFEKKKKKEKKINDVPENSRPGQVSRAYDFRVKLYSLRQEM